MAEKLIVKNFAGIKELEIEVKSINILIGPQASGKSVCAKLLFYFKSFATDILFAAQHQQTKRNIDSSYKNKFKQYFPPESWENTDFLIRYEIADVFIEITKSQRSSRGILLKYSDFYNKKLLPEIRLILEKEVENKYFYGKKDEQEITREINKQLVEYLNKYLGKEAGFFQVFIPAGRSFFAQFESSIFSLLESNSVIDPFLIAFGSWYQMLKRISVLMKQDDSPEGKEINNKVYKIIEETLCGEYIHKNGKDFLKTTDGRLINVANSSSGQQETLPLLIMLAALPFAMRGQTVYIEEPEAHLFPSAQRNITELIATVFNSRKEQLQFFITTHSPYILTSINNLLQAGSLYEQSISLDELEKIVPRYKALMLSDLSAYALENGKCTTIVCPDTGLIDANVIDSISNDLAIEFDKLLNLIE
ncbi:MAG TPA: AAA family ATPase [Halomicronema sp.]